MRAQDQPDPTARLDRVGRLRYVGRNDRGAELRVSTAGTAEHFTPGELLQLAIGACSALSADHVLASRLGEDFAARVDVAAQKTDDGYRYERLLVDLLVELGSLEPERRTALVERATKAIDRHCGIGHTLDHPGPIPHEVRIRDAR